MKRKRKNHHNNNNKNRNKKKQQQQETFPFLIMRKYCHLVVKIGPSLKGVI